MQTFELFGTTHLLTLLTIVVIAALLIVLYRKYPPLRTPLRIGLALCTLLSFPLHLGLAATFSSISQLETTLPLHLCDLAALLGGIALITQSQRLTEVAYFWGLAGTLQGLLTPNLLHDFPSPGFISFFWNHGFVVITALFFPLAMRWRPRPRAYLWVFGVTQIYLVVGLVVNFVLETNFGYLHHKPNTASLLDYFPPWPGYILILELLCFGLFFILSLPFSGKSEK